MLKTRFKMLVAMAGLALGAAANAAGDVPTLEDVKRHVAHVWHACPLVNPINVRLVGPSRMIGRGEWAARYNVDLQIKMAIPEGMTFTPHEIPASMCNGALGARLPIGNGEAVQELIGRIRVAEQEGKKVKAGTVYKGGQYSIRDLYFGQDEKGFFAKTNLLHQRRQSWQ